MTDLVGANYWRLPVEMQQRAQWCLAGPDKAPYLVGPEGLYHASPVSGPWLDFESALYYAAYYKCKIGFIITAADPFTCIDMDVKDAESRDKNGVAFGQEFWTQQEALDFYKGVVQFSQSYTELSASGKGLHTWVYGDIGAGRRGKGIEVYSRERFIICTGVPVSDVTYHRFNGVCIPYLSGTTQLPLLDGSLILERLEQELGESNKVIELVEVGQELTDEEIWSRATTAGNSEKFVQLCKGNWKQYLFDSQSEADLALMSMFTFYSKSNEQCRRLFRQTVLGQREKANVNDRYLNLTLGIIRKRQEKENAAAEHGAAIAAKIMGSLEVKEPIVLQGEPVDAETLEVNPLVQGFVNTIDQASVVQSAPDNVVDFAPPEVPGLEWPPGLVGAIAGFIYQSSPRPVKEVSIVAALGLLAGITGKAYNVGQTGINLYIILVARSAIGKEAMHSGIGHIMKSPCGQVIQQFVNYTDFASGPALTKGLEAAPSFVNVSGEWGRKLQRMADDHRDGPMSQLRTVMTNIYQKSGSASVVGGLGYSNAEKNVASVNAVAYSMIGETTPGTFYDSLTQSMMDDGFLSRFNIIEYSGERPSENKNQMMKLPANIDTVLANMGSHASRICTGTGGIAIQIQKSPEAAEMLDAFNLECDDKIREAGEDESIRQIWNRAHLKAIRVAGVLAAADNHIKPIMTAEHATWALNLIRTDTSSMLRKVQDGDIGVDDTSRFKKLQTIIEGYLKGTIPASYKIDPKMRADGIVPRKYLQARSNPIRCFRNYRLGTTLALDHTLKTAIDSGYMMEVSKDKAIEIYGYHGRCFRILDLSK